MEWTGKYTTAATAVQLLDSDDDPDEEDPLKILAQSRMPTKMVTVLAAPTTLVTAADVAEAHSFDQLDPHAVHMCAVEQRHDTSHSKFLPHRTTKSDSHSVAHEKARTVGKHWEVTAATPPQLRNAEAQLLTLQESIAVQHQQKEAFKVFFVFYCFYGNIFSGLKFLICR